MPEKIVSFFYLKIFLLIIVLLIIGSIIFKIIIEVHDSRFTMNTFSVLMVSSDSKLVFVDKADKRVGFFAIGDVRKAVRGKDVFGASLALGVPVNAIIVDKQFPRNIAELTSSETQWRLMFDGQPFFKNMDRYDAYKFINAVKDTIKDNRVEKRINLFDDTQRKEFLKDQFKDSVINNMPYTIEIDNGTKINGLGGDFAYILGQEGFNVIAVRSVYESSNSFISYQGDRDMYIDSLISLTGFELKKEKVSQAADITIFLGDDLEAMLSP